VSQDLDSAPSTFALKSEIDESKGVGTILGDDEIRSRLKDRQMKTLHGSASSARSANERRDKTSLGSASNKTLQTASMAWHEPMPVLAKPSPQAYPWESLPAIIRDAASEVCECTQAPIAMVASSAICAMATACQALYDVKRDHHLHGPISLYFITLGDSGERKSTVDSLFSRAIHDFHEESIESSKREIMSYVGKLKAWEAQCAGVVGAITSARKNSKKSDKEPSFDELEKQLEELHHQKPERPFIPNLLVHDITIEKLEHQIATEWPSCTLLSAEGGSVLGGRSFARDNQLSTLAAFNMLWSGESFKVGRKTSDSFEINGARFSISLFIQPHVFGTFIEDNDLCRSVGFLPRCLFSFPESTQGKRMYKSIPQSLSALEAFNSRVTKLLRIPPVMSGRRLVPTLIPLSDAAFKLWVEFHDSIETSLGNGKTFEGIRDFGSKAAENAARLAAVFQIANELPVKEVSALNMEAACKIVHWHLGEVVRYFGSGTSKVMRLTSDAGLLDRKLLQLCRERDHQHIDRSFLLSRGPEKFRKIEKIMPLLEFLASKHRIRIYENGQKISINPALLLEGQEDA